MSHDALLEAIHELVPDREQELVARAAEPKPPLINARGLWKGMKVDISAEEIKQYRREMWGAFPKGHQRP